MQIERKTQGKAYRKAIKLGRKGVIELLKKKNLKGRGGAGFSTGQKWEFVYNEKSLQKYVICNADEGEPGTFKDKLIIKKNPETLIEGILIACYCVGANQAYIYLRGEYDYLENKLKKAISSVTNLTKSKIKIDIIVGAGAYICGDETAILNSIEGKRGQARTKPPFPTTKGLWGKPTIINNVETLTNAAQVLLLKDWDFNLRLFSVSGCVEKPGVYERPLGTKLSQLLLDASPCHKLKAVYLGCFGGCIPANDVQLTKENIAKEEGMLGACTIIVVDETKSIVDMAVNIAKFYEFESCGKCTPCREGTMRVLQILEKISLGKGTKKDIETLEDLGEVMKETSFCGLGQTSTQHLLTALKHFRHEFEEKCK